MSKLTEFTLEALKAEVSRRTAAAKAPKQLVEKDWDTFVTEVDEWVKQGSEDGYLIDQ